MRRLVALVASLPLVASCASLERVAYDTGIRSARAAAGVERRQGAIEGAECAWLERSGKGVPLVLVHAFASEKDAWLPFAIALGGDAPLLVPDLPGHGESERDEDGAYDAGALADWLADFADARGCERYHLAGVSSGATIAALHAAAYPERVVTLALFDPVGAVGDAASEATAAILSGDNPLLPHDERSFELLLTFLFAGEPPLPWPARSVLCREYIERSEWNGKLWDELWLSVFALLDALPDVEAPALVVWGEADRVAHPSEAEVVAAALADARLVRLPACGHASVLECPTETAAALAELLAEPPIEP